MGRFMQRRLRRDTCVDTEANEDIKQYSDTGHDTLDFSGLAQAIWIKFYILVTLTLH